MAVGAIQLHDWPSWAAANGFEVECVIQLDGRRIPPVFAYGGEFRMIIGQVVDVPRVNCGRASGLKIGVTFGAGFFVGGDNIYSPAMLGMAGGAVRSARLISVVDRAVMARETSLILDLC
jgi:hypothetical protein